MTDKEKRVNIKLHIYPTDFIDALSYVKTYFKNSLKCEKKVEMYLKKTVKYDWSKNTFENSAKIIEKYIELEVNQRSSRIELLEHNIKKLENLESRFMKYTYSKNFSNLLKIMSDFNKILEYVKEIVMIKRELKETEKKTPWETSKIAKMIEKSKTVLKQKEVFLHKVGDINIGLIKTEKANFEEFPKTLSIIILKYFENMNIIREKIIEELDNFKKQINNNATNNFSEEFFTILKKYISTDEINNGIKSPLKSLNLRKDETTSINSGFEKADGFKEFDMNQNDGPIMRPMTIMDDNYVAYITHLYEKDNITYDEPNLTQNCDTDDFPIINFDNSQFSCEAREAEKDYKKETPSNFETYF